MLAFNVVKCWHNALLYTVLQKVTVYNDVLAVYVCVYGHYFILLQFNVGTYHACICCMTVDVVTILMLWPDSSKIQVPA